LIGTTSYKLFLKKKIINQSLGHIRLVSDNIIIYVLVVQYGIRWNFLESARLGKLGDFGTRASGGHYNIFALSIHHAGNKLSDAAE
jgi:hypothetical protein